MFELVGEFKMTPKLPKVSEKKKKGVSKQKIHWGMQFLAHSSVGCMSWLKYSAFIGVIQRPSESPLMEKDVPFMVY